MSWKRASRSPLGCTAASAAYRPAPPQGQGSAAGERLGIPQPHHLVRPSVPEYPPCIGLRGDCSGRCGGPSDHALEFEPVWRQRPHAGFTGLVAGDEPDPRQSDPPGPDRCPRRVALPVDPLCGCPGSADARRSRRPHSWRTRSRWRRAGRHPGGKGARALMGTRSRTFASPSRSRQDRSRSTRLPTGPSSVRPKTCSLPTCHQVGAPNVMVQAISLRRPHVHSRGQKDVQAGYEVAVA